MRLKNRTVMHRVFATSCFSRVRRVDGQIKLEPASQVHAKTMGTTVTLCGQSALSWFKFWDIAFVNISADRCPRCSLEFAKRTATGEGN